LLINDFLPKYDVNERHQISVSAPIGRVYVAAKELDISGAKVTRWLFRLRGLPASSQFAKDDFLKIRLISLAEKENEEAVLGLVGKFWKPTGNLLKMDAEGFLAFNQSGYAKAVWNFSLQKKSDNHVILATETRVFCLDDQSRKWFRLYWTLIGAFSGLIRKEILQIVKQNAEKVTAEV
jgi:hypothetical protein